MGVFPQEGKSLGYVFKTQEKAQLGNSVNLDTCPGAYFCLSLQELKFTETAAFTA